MQARGLGIRLASPSPADAETARGVKYRSRYKGFKAGEKAKMAAITGESIFGSGTESAAQARRKAVLVKAAKLGIKTKNMRLLKLEHGQETRRSRMSSSGHRVETTAGHVSRGSDSYGREKRVEVRRGSTKRQRHSEIATGGEPDDDGRGWRDEKDADVEGSTRDSNTEVLLVKTSVSSKVGPCVSEKKQTRRSPSRAKPPTSAGSATGLAAIATLY